MQMKRNTIATKVAVVCGGDGGGKVFWTLMHTAAIAIEREFAQPSRTHRNKLKLSSSELRGGETVTRFGHIQFYHHFSFAAIPLAVFIVIANHKFDKSNEPTINHCRLHLVRTNNLIPYFASRTGPLSAFHRLLFFAYPHINCQFYVQLSTVV